MTISYQRDVASSTAGGFTRLLFKWKGSLYKLIYREVILFMGAYILLSLVYRQLLNKSQRALFEMVVKYFDAFLNLIPLSFVLGFYVSYVASRWWQQFLAIPWPDKLFHSVACYVDGFDEESRMLRRNLMRYMNLALILVLRSISSAVKQRFPTLDHVVEAGFMTNSEKELFNAVPANEFNTYWVPCTWFIYRLKEAAKKDKLLNPYALETIMREFCEFRAKCGLLWCYDWVSIPMVYTQVVTLATYVFFIFTVIGRQKIDTIKKGEYMRSGRMPMDIDLYIPIFTILQFYFYMGLLKVAEQLINPFGDDDEDFELNWLIDRHMKASFLGCDILMDPDRIPIMVKDYYWDKQNMPIPYTEASMHFKKKTYKGSADDMIVPESKQHMVLPEIEEEGEDLNQRHSKLSLTSLLLESTILTSASVGLNPSMAYPRSSLADGIGSPENPAISYDRSPAPRHYQPGAWRNSLNGPQPQTSGTRRSNEVLNNSGHDLRLPIPTGFDDDEGRRGSDSHHASSNFFNASIDSVEEEDCDVDRGVNGGGRRTSKLSDLFEKKRRPDKKRWKDKQGFVWRRMIPYETEDLPRPRTPHLGQGAAPWISYEQQQQQQQRQHNHQQLIPMTRQQHQQGGDGPHTTSNNDHRRTKSNPGPEQDDSTSLTSFKTCPSDPNLLANLLPRQVFDNYEEVSRLHRSRDQSVLSGGSDVTLSPTRVSKRPSLQSQSEAVTSPSRASGPATPNVHTRPRLKDAEFY